MMKLSAKIGAALVCAALVSPAHSEETQTAEVLSVMQQIASLHSSLNGMTATLTGGLGTIVGDQIYFQSDLGRFRVQFDAGREARRRIEGCSITLFGNVESRCVFEVDAELRVSESFNLADGGEIRLIVYSIR